MGGGAGGGEGGSLVDVLVDLLVVQHVVTVGKGASLDVLPREAHVNPLAQQRAKGKGLPQRPVGLLPSHHVSPPSQHATQC